VKIFQQQRSHIVKLNGKILICIEHVVILEEVVMDLSRHYYPPLGLSMTQLTFEADTCRIQVLLLYHHLQLING